jgi:hypothetical protein
LTGPLRIEKLQRINNVETFDCDQEALNRFLIRYALQNQQAGASQTYVALNTDEVIGFYTLVFDQVQHAHAPERLTKELARHPVPVMLLARLPPRLVGKARHRHRDLGFRCSRKRRAGTRIL